MNEQQDQTQVPTKKHSRRNTNQPSQPTEQPKENNTASSQPAPLPGNPSIPPPKDNGNNTQDVSLAIIGAGLANAIALIAVKDPFNLWNAIVGIIILCILGAFSPASDSPHLSLRVAYAAVWSISFLTAIGFVLNIIFQAIGWPFPDYNSQHFTAYPDSPDVFLNKTANRFTPLNVYDGGFFLAWLVIFFIVFWVHKNKARFFKKWPFFR